MWAYIIRRLLLTIPTVLGVVLLTFVLFSLVAKDPARAYAGKQATEATLKSIRHEMGIDKPRFLNVPEAHERGVVYLFDSQFFDLLRFKFYKSMRYEQSVWQLIATKGPVSLAIQLPAFFISLALELVIALFAAAKRGTGADYSVTALAVVTMSVPVLSLYIGAQWLFGAKLAAFPIAGWVPGFYAIQFAALPILCTVFAQWGAGARLYRTVVLDEVSADYVRTASAKGVSKPEVYLTHVLRNVMIPVITNTVTTLPFLLFGALILERLFQIPGLGGLLVDAIFSSDRSPVMGITYVTAIAYCLAVLLSDILYTLADPRVSLK
ncbi:MAG TPA: ABC transporter permease [Tepidisphaeraceae bacterium]|jgi:peptide/nickel transport system permease protein|nr:ABC transporter permease [Tepidisphaeraceae bacterium]